jgi:hypothetical protein
MVALALLCIAFLFLLSIIPVIASCLKSGENYKGASLVANGIIERVKNTEFSLVKTQWRNLSGQKSLSGYSNGVPYTASYIYQVDVLPSVADPQEDYLQDVVVRVGWTEKGRDKSYILETCIFNRSGL